MLKSFANNVAQNAVQASQGATIEASQAATTEILQSPVVHTEASQAALPSPAALKNGIVQLMTELNRDTEFKKMIGFSEVEALQSMFLLGNLPKK